MDNLFNLAMLRSVRPGDALCIARGDRQLVSAVLDVREKQYYLSNPTFMRASPCISCRPAPSGPYMWSVAEQRIVGRHGETPSWLLGRFDIRNKLAEGARATYVALELTSQSLPAREYVEWFRTHSNEVAGVIGRKILREGGGQREALIAALRISLGERFPPEVEALFLANAEHLLAMIDKSPEPGQADPLERTMQFFDELQTPKNPGTGFH